MTAGGFEERTIGGLHDHLMTEVLPRYFPRGGQGAPAVDLGAGSGALAVRLRDAGFDVVAVEREAAAFRAPVPLEVLDLDEDDVPAHLGAGRWRLVTAVEVIEHLASPLRLLSAIAELLDPDGGLAVVTTPNVDNLPARVKFLLSGRLRMMDAAGDPTHISPIFVDLLYRQLLPRAGLEVVAHTTYPPDWYLVSRPAVARLFAVAARAWRRPFLLGDNHVLILRRARSAA